MEAAAADLTSPWPRRRGRAEELRARYPFAAEVLALYLALLDVQEEATTLVEGAEPLTSAASVLLPRVVDATVAAGPPLLAEAAVERLGQGEPESMLAAWLEGSDLEPVDRYLARATLSPLLEAMPSVRELCSRAAGERHCPECGGLPQLSWLGSTGESLVAGRRHLLCSRCHSSWTVPRAACAGCGALLTVHAESTAEASIGEPATDQLSGAVFPHLRVEGCEQCHRYLLGVDLGRDARAVPEVDELAAIPLDLYAQERDLYKITPNLMGM
ncbi:MAG: formate dehydrogenase accessory protein FdhE [Candidatus Dormibacteraeota bacterium]|nr:formate dehydrogenase accessory protein FdhE [Candidatus Dormibacteraeota bacterium]